MMEQSDKPVWLFGEDGLHEVLEDLHRVRREETESSILAHLLRHAAYRATFLQACGLDWLVGEYAQVRPEVPLDGDGVADIEVCWEAGHTYRLLIEHKPWAHFTAAQPANYVRALLADSVDQAAFVLLVGGETKSQAALTLILSSGVVDSPVGIASWEQLEARLTLARGQRYLRTRPAGDIARALSTVEGPALHQALAKFWFSRQPLEPILIPADDKGRVEALVQELQLAEAATWQDLQRFGVYVFWKSAGRHTELVWFGVAPPVARQLGVPPGSIVVVRGGQLPASMTAALVEWAATHALVWIPVQAGTRIAEWAVALAEDDAVAALADLAERMKLPRRRGKK